MICKNVYWFLRYSHFKNCIFRHANETAPTVLLVMLTTDSTDPSDKDFFFLINSINHRSQNPCQHNDQQSISSQSTNGINPSVKNWTPNPIFLNKGKSVDILQ
jgi:hypothetical protein